ncbi:hypothetical protein [Robbsia sp. KACC 23696]|uniref:hypothetical protein n=1 Tax=Robbsia sp. KACC 23696 TaxID=3149231 RepID=UPI00325AC40A
MNQDELMQALAHALSQTLGPNVGFVLLTANFGQIGGGRVNYISNGRREDMVAMMREYLARVDGNYHEGGKA